MGRYVLQRVLMTFPVIFGVITATFFLLHLVPGDPAAVVAGPNAPPDVVEKIRQDLGLELPLWKQYTRYIMRVIRGDLGTSIISKQEVTSEIARAFVPSLELIVMARLWSLVLAIFLGVMAAIHRRTLLDKVSMALGLIGVSLPVFWIGLFLMWLFGYHWRLLPISGRGGSLLTWEGFRTIILPSLTLGAVLVGPLARVTRSSLLEVLGLDYIRTGWAKGLGPRRIFYRHALKNALLPVVTVAGMQFGYLLGGAVVTETIFAWPGMGRLVVGAILSKDFPLVQGLVMVMAIVFVVTNLLVDLLYAYLDPRIRFS